MNTRQLGPLTYQNTSIQPVLHGLRSIDMLPSMHPAIGHWPKARGFGMQLTQLTHLEAEHKSHTQGPLADY